MTEKKVCNGECGGAVMPSDSLETRSEVRTIGALILELKEHNEVTAKALYPTVDRFVMGFPLAPWQREFKWTDEQCVRFITSAWTGVALGSYTVNHERVQRNSPLELTPLSNVVIDGQQRLMALQKYLLDEIAVPDVAGTPRLYSEISQLERRRFNRIVFTRSSVASDDEHQLREFYDLLNFGGIAHEEHERAVPRTVKP